MTEAERKTVKIHYNGAPITLRIDEMVEGEMGIRTARQTGQIDLLPGDNEVDAERWAAWLAANKENPLVTGSHVFEATKEDAEHGESSRS